MDGLGKLSLSSDGVSIKSGVLIAFGNGDVPDNLLLEVRVVFDLVPRSAEKDMHIQTILVMQHPEQRGIVLDGVGAEDGEPIHQRQDSKVVTSFLAADVALCWANGFRFGAHSILDVSNCCIL